MSSKLTPEISSLDLTDIDPKSLEVLNLVRGEPIRYFARNLLGRILPSDSEFTAFVMDFFPNTARTFSIGLNRTDKANILLEKENTEEILEKLRKTSVDKYAEAERTQVIRQTAANISIALNTNDLKIWTLKLKGEFGLLNWEDINKIIDMLRKAANSADIKISKVEMGCIALEIISSQKEYLHLKTYFRGKSIGALRVEEIKPMIAKRGKLRNFLTRNSIIKKEKEEALINAYLIAQGAYSSRNNDRIKTLSNQNEALMSELHFYQERPPLHSVLYDVIVLGISASGKTSLIRKITDPSFASMSIPYPVTPTQGHCQNERTMIIQYDDKQRRYMKYGLRFHEWGGKYPSEALHFMRSVEIEKGKEIVDASDIRFYSGIHALILVADLGINDFSEGRINEQIMSYFNLDYLDSLLKIKSITNVILFINKSDLLSGKHSDIQMEIRKRFSYLIDNLNRMRASNYSANTHVIIGSVYTDMGLVRLYSYLVETSVGTMLKTNY